MSVIMQNIGPLAEVALPDIALGISTKEMLEHLKYQGFFDTEMGWMDWTENMSQDELANFLNKLVHAVMTIKDKKFSGDPSVEGQDTFNRPAPIKNTSGAMLCWKNSALDDICSDDSSRLRPGLVLTSKCEITHWETFRSFCEVKSDLSQTDDGQRKALGHIKAIFEAQMNRRFVLGSVLAGGSISLIYADRAGMFASKHMDINNFPEHFLRIVVGLHIVDEKHLGYDSSLRLKKGVGEAVMNGTNYRASENIHAESDVFGRGTMCFQVEHPTKKTACCMKDAWVEVRNSPNEALVLSEFAQLGITNVARLVDWEEMKVDGEVESTHNIRLALNKGMAPVSAAARQKNEAGPEAREVSAKTHKDEGTSGPHELNTLKGKAQAAMNQKKRSTIQPERQHRRLVIEPYGQDMCMFRCLEELLLIIKDIISAIQQLHQNGYLHRDISIYNIVLAESDNDAFQDTFKRLQGFLIDFDLAIKMVAENLSARARMTGTVPFMSIDVLRASSPASGFCHDYYHDLESLFYVLLCICTFFKGPNGAMRNRAEYKGSIVLDWMHADSSSDQDLMKVASSKACLADLSNFEKALDEFHPYFKPIFGCLRRMHQCLFPPCMEQDERSMAERKLRSEHNDRKEYRKVVLTFPHKERDSSVVFEELFSIIDTCRESLPEAHRLKHDYSTSDLASYSEDEEIGDDSDSESDSGPAFSVRCSSFFDYMRVDDPCVDYRLSKDGDTASTSESSTPSCSSSASAPTVEKRKGEEDRTDIRPTKRQNIS